ncbi:MAG: AAA family ATPase [Myxococcales bacterium]|nr:AAA family ATPase [Myxococcales bacterium]
MALLHYQNLDDPNPNMLLERASTGLRDFREFLKRTQDFLEHEDNVLRLGWAPAEPPAWAARDERGVWIELNEPADVRSVSERTFDAFLDEEVGELFELPRTSSSRTSGRVGFNAMSRLRVFDRDPDTCRLLLDREPAADEVCLRPNTRTLRRQLDAVHQLQDAPAPAHRALLRLLEREDRTTWPALPALEPTEWRILTDLSRPGTEAQRRFVQVAIATPDFAFLEGPPGSGKTTAICELVLQLIARGQRVLLCASTHVAVDNVLERVGPLTQQPGSDLVAVRVGDRRKVSEQARPYQLEEFVRTERERLQTFLRGLPKRSEAQEGLYRALAAGSTAIERMVLDTANLVCGTTSGILSHPDIKFAHAPGRAGMFDTLIVDEASKTTFQDFLVPALLAQRWILVGDPRQLSPFVEEAALAANLRAALPNPVRRDACVDVFLASGGRAARASAIWITTREEREHYERQATALGVELADAATATARDLATSGIVIGTQQQLEARAAELPLDLATLRGLEGSSLERRAAAVQRRLGAESGPPCWEDELAWRLCRHFEQRQRGDSRSAARLREEADALLPTDPDEGKGTAFREQIDRVRRVAFPSILESIQCGFRADSDAFRARTALTHGMLATAFTQRHVVLNYQHRMHPDISRVPREQVYQGTALLDPPDMATRRAWGYQRYEQRAVWLHVNGRFDSKRNRNEEEVDAVLREIDHFVTWARHSPKRSHAAEARVEPWEVAVLAFYRGQERALRDRLRQRTGQRGAYRHFELRSEGRTAARIELCTVDRFQGHEADVVFLTLANTRMTSFLESTNRVNVAITRARFQRVLIGNRNTLRRREGSLLSFLAANEPWVRDLEAGR